MKLGAQVAIAGAMSAAMIACSNSQASLIGLFVAEVPAGPGAPPAGGPLRIAHVFAEFTSASDRVNAWGGGGNLGPGIIQNMVANFSVPGSGFTQVGGAGGQLSPYSTGSPRDWDTYMTIGVRYGNEAPGGLDASSLIPGTPVFIAGTSVTFPGTGGGVFVTPDDDQGRADYRISGPDTNMRVLLMQLVVNAGEAVRGTIGINWSVDGVAGSAVNVTGMSFSFVTSPSPGPLALVGLGGLIGPRRRRS